MACLILARCCSLHVVFIPDLFETKKKRIIICLCVEGRRDSEEFLL